jgi:hypothetical protein
MDVVESKGRLRSVAEGGVGLARIVFSECVAVEKDVAILIFGELEIGREALDEAVAARALGERMRIAFGSKSPAR